jgi:hypothetical protein
MVACWADGDDDATGVQGLVSRSTHQEVGGLEEARPAVGLEWEEAGRRNRLVGIDHLLGPSGQSAFKGRDLGIGQAVQLACLAEGGTGLEQLV